MDGIPRLVIPAFGRQTDGHLGTNGVLLLTVTGRKSGKPHTIPLGFFDHPSGYIIVASNGGNAANPAWYLNLVSRPQVQVQVFEQQFSTTAELLTGEEREQAWQTVVRTSPGYASYATATTREIPLLLLRPAK